MNRFTQKVLSGGIAAGLSLAVVASANAQAALGGLDPECARGRMAHDGT